MPLYIHAAIHLARCYRLKRRSSDILEAPYSLHFPLPYFIGAGCLTDNATNAENLNGVSIRRVPDPRFFQPSLSFYVSRLKVNEWIARNIVYRLIERVRGEPVSKYLKRIIHIPYLSRDEIARIQAEKLRQTITRAYEDIPFYRRRFDEAGLDIGSLKFPEDLARIPVLEKQEVREHYAQIVNHSLDVRTSKESTSGSSGTPLVVVKDRDKSAYVRAVMYRCYAQYGIDIGDKQARFWGMPVDRRDHAVEKIKDILSNRIRLSAFEVDDESLAVFVSRLREFKPLYFCGYPSLIYKFCQWMSDRNIVLEQAGPSVVITTGEVLYEFQRELIEKTLGCRIANEYGATETGVIAFECREGNMHINSDHVCLEVLASGNADDAGDLVVTELNNLYNPLIRYKIGDVGSVSCDTCSCGIGFPILKAIVGRQSSFIVTPEDKYFYSAILAYTFKEGIKHFQGVQDRKDELVVRIVKDDSLTEEMLREYKQKLSDRLGRTIKIRFDFVSCIEPDKSGKLRYFVSNIGSDE
ncbi:MAG: phenylacetate--CoA ligase family protein [Deltaproteobacteria bacterium]|nr:phenylacetate--CoA ligase family protein [Deltaproteobacteria bacterium]